MTAISIGWFFGAIGIQVLLNLVSRKINYAYGTKMELLAIGLNVFVWGMMYFNIVEPSIQNGTGIPISYYLFALTSSILISIIFIDLKYYEIPNSYNFIIAVFGVIYIFENNDIWLHYLLGGLIAFGIFFLIAIFTGGNLGMGDVKLAGGLGFFIGKGMLMFQFFMFTFLSGALISLFLLAFKMKKPNDKIAFGPYICFAFIWMLLS